MSDCGTVPGKALHSYGLCVGRELCTAVFSVYEKFMGLQSALRPPSFRTRQEIHTTSILMVFINMHHKNIVLMK